ncbi:hypothetical protein Bca4012_066947 [Brassica carinata]
MENRTRESVYPWVRSRNIERREQSRGDWIWNQRRSNEATLGHEPLRVESFGQLGSLQPRVLSALYYVY